MDARDARPAAASPTMGPVTIGAVYEVIPEPVIIHARAGEVLNGSFMFCHRRRGRCGMTLVECTICRRRGAFPFRCPVCVHTHGAAT